MIVIDTSVVFKWFDKSEDGYPAAVDILKKHWRKEQKIIVPTLIFDELTNAWATKSNLLIKKINRNFILLEKYNLLVVTFPFSLRKKSIIFSRKYHCSSYDATYAVLAKSKKCNLITADVKFVKKVNLPFVKLLGE